MTETRPSTISGAGPSDAALVVAARARESWAEEALFVRHAPRILGLAQRLLGRSDDTDDLVQDAFVQAISRLEQLDNPQAFAAWISTLTVRLAQKRLRRRRLLARLGLRTNEPIDVETLVAANSPPEAAVELCALYAIIGRMPAEERIALVLRRVEGMELAEVAQHMCLSLATVKRRLAAAERQLRSAQGLPQVPWKT